MTLLTIETAEEDQMIYDHVISTSGIIVYNYKVALNNGTYWI